MRGFVLFVIAGLFLSSHSLRVKETVFSNNEHTLKKSRIQSVLDVPAHNHVMYSMKLNDELKDKIVTLDDPAVHTVTCSDDLSAINVGHIGATFDVTVGDIVSSSQWCLNYETQTAMTARKVVKVMQNSGSVVLQTEHVPTANLFEDLELSVHHAVASDAAFQRAGVPTHRFTGNTKTADELFDDVVKASQEQLVVEDSDELAMEQKGFLKSLGNAAKSVGNAVKSVGTAVAKIADAVGDAWKKVKGVVGKIASALKGDINFEKSLTLAKFTWNKEKRPLTLWQQGSMKLECASCIFNFEGVTVSAAVKVKTFKLQDGTGLTFGSGANADFVFEFKFDKQATKSFNKELVTVFQTVIVVPVGPIPVPITVKVPIVGGFKLMLDSNFVATARIQAGFTIKIGTVPQGGSFKAVNEIGNKFSFDLHADAQIKAGAQAYIGPKLSVALADMAGIATGLYPWGEVGINIRLAAGTKNSEGEKGAYCALWYAFGIEVPLKGQYGFPFLEKNEVDFAVFRKEFIRRERDCAPEVLKKLLGGEIKPVKPNGFEGPAVDKGFVNNIVPGKSSPELTKFVGDLAKKKDLVETAKNLVNQGKEVAKAVKEGDIKGAVAGAGNMAGKIAAETGNHDLADKIGKANDIVGKAEETINAGKEAVKNIKEGNIAGALDNAGKVAGNVGANKAAEAIKKGQEVANKANQAVNAGKEAVKNLQEGNIAGALDNAGKAAETVGANKAAEAIKKGQEGVKHVEETVKKARETVEHAKEAVEDAVEHAKDTVNHAKEAAEGAVEHAKDAVEDAVEHAKDAVEDAKNKAEEQVNAVKNSAEAQVKRATEAVEHHDDDHKDEDNKPEEDKPAEDKPAEEKPAEENQEGGEGEARMMSVQEVEDAWDHFQHDALTCDVGLCNNNGVCMMGKCVCDDGWTGSDCSQVDEKLINKECSSQCRVVEDDDVSFCKHLVGEKVCASVNELADLDRMAISRANESSTTYSCFFKQLAVHCDMLIPRCDDDNKVDAFILEDCTDVHNECDFHAPGDSHIMYSSVARCRGFAVNGMETRTLIDRKMVEKLTQGQGRKMRAQEKTTANPMGRCEVAKAEDLIACPHLAGKQVFVYAMYGSVLAANLVINTHISQSPEIGDCLHAEYASLCHSFLPVCNNAGDNHVGMCTKSCKEVLAPCRDLKESAVEGFCSATNVGFASSAPDCHEVSLDALKGSATVKATESIHRDIMARRQRSQKGGSKSTWMWIALPGVGVLAVAILVSAAVVIRRRREGGDNQSELAFIASV